MVWLVSFSYKGTEVRRSEMTQKLHKLERGTRGVNLGMM